MFSFFVTALATSPTVTPRWPQPLPGGLSLIDIDDSIKELATRAVLEFYNTGGFADEYFRSVWVLEAKSQVVDGTKTHLKVIIAETECSADLAAALVNPENPTTCPILANGQAKVCYFTVWEKASEDAVDFDLVGCINIEYGDDEFESADEVNERFRVKFH